MEDLVRTQYVSLLLQARAMETQEAHQLAQHIRGLEDLLPEVAARLRTHIAESQVQRRRLDTLLCALGAPRATVLEFLAQEGRVVGFPAADPDGEALGCVCRIYAREHLEIASYSALLVIAEAAGDKIGVEALGASLREEEAMASWAREVVPMIARRRRSPGLARSSSQQPEAADLGR